MKISTKNNRFQAASGAEQKNADAPEGGRRRFDMLSILGGLKTAKEEVPANLFSEAHVAEARRATSWLKDRLRKSTNLHNHELIEETVSMTPVMAEVILSECNRGNRKLSRSHIDWFADIITDGRWKFTAHGISFSPAGELNNGQHRLHAIVKAGRTVPIKVSFGEPREVFPILDTGRTRRAGDAVYISGFKNANHVAAAARLHMILTSNAPLGKHRFHNDVINEYVQANSRIEDATTPALTLARRTGCSITAMTTAIYMVSSNTEFLPRLDKFLDLVRDGNIPNKRNPALVLRDGLMKREFEGYRDGTGKNILVTAAIILAWNKWLRGNNATTASLRWNTSTPFPKPE